MNKDNCCYKCKDRHIGCHAECSKYKEFKAVKRDKHAPYKFIPSVKERTRLREE